jgi:histidine triad (HIT) family protein
MVRRDPDCPFCKIVAGEVPADVIARSDAALAFRDINPQAPVHVLVVPREHHADAPSAAAAGTGVMDEIVRLASEVAQAEGVAEDGYRLVFNTGKRGGQVVFHLHGHVLGGRDMTWPPG